MCMGGGLGNAYATCGPQLGRWVDEELVHDMATGCEAERSDQATTNSIGFKLVSDMEGYMPRLLARWHQARD